MSSDAATPPAPRTLAPGWRCEACEYLLEGLPDRAEETQCPECGYIGRPVGAPAVPRTAAVALAIVISIACGIAGGFAGIFAYAASRADTSPAERTRDGLIGLAFALGVLYVGIVVWSVPFARWRIARYIALIVPVAVGAFSGYWLLRSGGLLELAFFAWSVLALSYLLCPELDAWSRRRRPWSIER